MPELQLIKEPNPLLRQKSLPVDKIDNSFKEFMMSLLETMYEEGGMGIAAIQVGFQLRALIVDVPHKEKNESGEITVSRTPYFIINPKVASLSKETVILNEECLSVRETDGIEFIQGEVERPKSISITYMDLEGNPLELSIDGNKSEYDLWFARCLQHELDHLDGILFIDKIVSYPTLDEL